MSDQENNQEFLNINQTRYKTRLSKKYREREPYKKPDITKVKCFIPGTIVEICVKVGDEVKEGQDLLILEAMKMKNRIKSHASAKIRRIEVTEGQKVAKGDLLIVLI